MSVIIKCNIDQKEKLTRFWKRHTNIKDGTEGSLYLVNDNLYKVYYDEYRVEDPICKDDLNLDSFLFPNEIYMHNEKVFAYKTPYIKNNILNLSSMIKGWNPDINKFKNALDKLILDTYMLSKNNIAAIDFTFRNTIYDGEKFYIIDTLDYQKVDEDTLDENIDSLKRIINCFILDYKMAYELNDIEKNEDALNEVLNLLNYIDQKVAEFNNEYKNTDIIKMRD